MDGDGRGGRKTEPQAGEPTTRGSHRKCQMSQRHSGKTLLFNMAPQSAVEAANPQ